MERCGAQLSELEFAWDAWRRVRAVCCLVCVILLPGELLLFQLTASKPVSAGWRQSKAAVGQTVLGGGDRQRQKAGGVF